ncbi:MAG: efflux RND transporter periplasmic adaptor subunit [Chloroflexi bacterium]|nr:efflux RND transporter periplasmic adaptor subunit [Chloroflexota bacterium]
MKVRRTIFVLVIITLTLPALLFARRAGQETESAQTAADVQSLTQYVVTTGTLEVTISALGFVEADQSAAISFSAPGRIAEVLVRSGDTVRSGDMLARQSDETQQLALDAARLQLDAAQLQRENLLAGPDETDLAIADANIDAAMGAYNSVANAVDPDQLRAAELQYAAAQQALTDAQTRRSTSNGSPEQIALLDARVGEASFNAEISRLSVESLRQGASGQAGAAWARVEQAQAEQDRLLAGPTQAQMDSADAAVARAQLAVDRAQQAVDRTVLTAPFDGLVTGVNGQAGSISLPAVAVVTLADLDPLRLRVQVDEIDVRQVRTGMDARVRLDALPSLSLPARLETIDLIPAIEGGIVNYGVEVVLPEADPRVRLGMTAEAQIVTARRDGVLVVPNQYIRLDRRTGEAFVSLLQADGTLVETRVGLGLQGSDASEVVEGVRDGDVLAVDLGSDSITGLGG